MSKKKIIDYCTKDSNAKTALEEWYKKVSKFSWENLNELKEDFPSADYVGNNRVVFNIKGNDYRLIAIVIYVSHKLYIRWIGPHSAYDVLDIKNI